jgi:hypothetical protein
MNLLKGSFWLKMAALVMAVLSYGLIRSELARNDAKSVTDPSYKLIKLTAKSLPVNVRIESAPPAGFSIDDDSIRVNPQAIVAIGPEALLDGASNAQTAIIDVSESTKTITRKIPIESIAGIHIAGSPFAVEVTVPIRKIVSDSAKPAGEPQAAAA